MTAGQRHPVQIEGEGGQTGVTRRQVLRWLVAGAGTATLASIVAACGGSSPTATSAPATSSAPAASSAPATSAAPTTAAAAPTAAAASTAPVTRTTSGGTGAPAPAVATGKYTFTRADRAKLKSPQRLIFAGLRDPDILDLNVTVFGHVHRALTSVYEPLIYEDRSGNFQPGLATAWEVSPDGTAYTFKLRQGVKFHDNTPFNAQAVKFAFDRIVDPATQSKRAINLIGPYDRSEVIDDSTVKIVLKRPFAGFLDGISYAFCGIPSPDAVKKFGADFARQPVATGPMKFKSWTAQDNVTHVKFPDYNWASPIFNLEGAGYLDEFIYKVVPEEATRVAILETGEVNMIDNVPPKEVGRLGSDPRFTVIREAAPGIPTIYMMNTEKPPLTDIKVRQALLHAIDRKVFSDAISYGVSPPAYGPLASNTFGYTKAIESLYPPDPRKAAELLDGAGWRLGGDGVRTKDGQRMVLDLLTITSNAQHELVQATLKEIGVAVNIKTGTDAWWQESGIRGDHHLLSEGVSGSDPFLLSWQFMSKNIGTGFARTRFRNARLDEVLDKGETSTNRDERIKLYGEAQQIIMDNALIIPITESVVIYATRREVKNVGLDARVFYPWMHSTYIEG